MKRIFIALPISPELKEKVKRCSSSYADFPVRWIASKNLHVTIIPPWQEQDIEPIKQKLNQITGQVPPFTLNFHQISLGPISKQPRLIWASGPTPPELMKLKQTLEAILELREEERPFKTHVTLARFRPQDFHHFPSKKLNETVDWQQTVNTIVLMESRLSPGGADYEVLAEFQF
jgi:RNA 2',3'-cyclic 3'-phosphodiesterase